MWQSGAQARSRTLQYHPDGCDFVCLNGSNRYTRALYGGYTDFRVETSDRPIFAIYLAKNHRNIRFRLMLNGRTVELEKMSHCEARYNAGMRTYKLSDPTLGKATLTVTVLAMPDSDAAIWQVRGEGLPASATLECIACGIKQPKLYRAGDMNSDPADSFDPAPDENNRQTVSAPLGQQPCYIYI